MSTRRQPSQSAKPKKKKKESLLVHPDMNIVEIVSLHDDAAGVLAAYGLHCVGCAYNQLETLREGAEAHGLTDDDIGNLVEDLTEVVCSAPARPREIVITEAAARTLLGIAKDQGKETGFLRVQSDESGGFCMEFEEKKNPEDTACKNDHVPELLFIASPSTLARIGGSTIDHRDGRFKLDVPNPAGGCSCSPGGKCDCRAKGS